MALTDTPNPKAGQIAPGAVRTATPFVVGLIGSWLTRHGLNINDDFLAALLVPAYGYAYYLGARVLEVYVSPRWKYILGLGIAQAPATYVKTPAVVTDSSGSTVITDDAPPAPEPAPLPPIDPDPPVYDPPVVGPLDTHLPLDPSSLPTAAGVPVPPKKATPRKRPAAKKAAPAAKKAAPAPAPRKRAPRKDTP